MTTTETHPVEGPEHLTRHLAEIVAGGSVGEAIGGGGAVVLAILCLGGVLPDITLPVAGLAVGGALMFIGAAVAARISRLLARTQGEGHRVELGSGMTAEFLGGAGGVVLSLLALTHVAPMAVMAVAALVYGGAVLLGSGVTSRLNHLESYAAGMDSLGREIAREATRMATGVQVLVALGAITLGILALTGTGPQIILMAVAFLALGGAILLSGSSVAARIISLFQE